MSSPRPVFFCIYQIVLSFLPSKGENINVFTVFVCASSL